MAVGMDERLIQRLRTAGDAEIKEFLSSGFDPHWLKGYKPHYDYIMGCYRKHGTMPSKKLMRDEFPDIDFYKISDPLGAIQDQIWARELQNTVADAVEKAQENFEEHKPKEARQTFMDLASLLSKEYSSSVASVDWASTASKRKVAYAKGWTLGIPTGWDDLDDCTGGFQAEQLISLVARPSIGKSWLLCYMALTAWKAGKSPMVITKEMSEDAFSRRLDAIEFSLDDRNIRKCDLTPELKDEYFAGLDKLSSEIPFHLVDIEKAPTSGISSLEAEIEDKNPDILFIDGVYLMHDEEGGKTRTDRIYNITQALKRLARKYKIPVVITAQMGREGVPKFKKGQLKQSGSLESIQWSDSLGQDSDVVLELAGEKGSPERHLTLMKQREGPLTTFMLKFLPQSGNFSEIKSAGVADKLMQQVMNGDNPGALNATYDDFDDDDDYEEY